MPTTPDQGSSGDLGNRNGPRSQMSVKLSAALADQPLIIARRLTNLGVSVHDEDTLLELMHQIAVEAVMSMADVDCAGITVQFDGSPFSMAHTRRRVLVLDERQYQADDGPCLRAMRTQHRVRMTVGEMSAHWPLIGAAAIDIDVHTVMAIPIPAYETLPAAALNLYSSTIEAFTTLDEPTITVLEEFLKRGITDYCSRQPELHRVMRLRAALAKRQTIALAVGVLLQRDPRLSTAQAELQLLADSVASEQTLLASAQQIVTTATVVPDP